MKLARSLSPLLFFAASALSAQIRTSGGTVLPEHESLRAQSEALSTQTDTYGTSSLTWLTVNMFEFQPTSTATTYSYSASPFGIYRTAGNPWFEAPLHLPAGASVSALQLVGCDTHASASLLVYFAAVDKAAVYTNPAGEAVASPIIGCQVVNAPAFTPWTVNNDTQTYMIEASFGSVADGTLLLSSVRVGYKLQVSTPPPGTQTFTDVPPTHPFYKFVEALYASGITAGCGNGNFCPDANVTRGQMAVFLSAALGLHWAP